MTCSDVVDTPTMRFHCEEPVILRFVQEYRETINIMVIFTQPASSKRIYDKNGLHGSDNTSTLWTVSTDSHRETKNLNKTYFFAY